MRYSRNHTAVNPQSVVMYIDMNSFFASCEQQLRPELRGRPIGVCAYDSPQAAVIAPSIEAKKFGVKTGMRLHECRELCPHIIPVPARPVFYRQFHIRIMAILNRYCDDVLPKSIDEAAMNLTNYRLVYKDMAALARQIKADIAADADYLKCSIGIAPNSFLAKLATDMQKPDGLVQITPENIDEQLSKLQLTDLPGIASRNARRLQLMGIKTPLEMRHASQAFLRKVFGGVVGHYWHARLNFGEVDFYKGDYRTMSATRTVSRQQRESKQSLESLLISLCIKLEQRLVKQNVFCKEVSFFVKYLDHTGWDTKIRFAFPVQDGMEIRQHILAQIHEFEQSRGGKSILNTNVRNMGLAIQNFISDQVLQYSLFDNRMKQDILRKAVYNIKDQYGKNSVRRAAELFEPTVMKDAIGFGSVKDLYQSEDSFNQYLIENDLDT